MQSRADSDSAFIKFLFNTDEDGKITGLLTSDSFKYYLAVLVGIGPTYAIWAFRDQNKLWEIENSRKDTNLKDFQQLQKWASGDVAAENITPKSEGGKDAKPLPDPLQISAIYQIGAFFRGEFGAQFSLAAYEILHAVWVKLLAEAEAKLPVIDVSYELEFRDAQQYLHNLRRYYDLLNYYMDNPIAKAVMNVVFGDGGRSLRELDESHKKVAPNSKGLLESRDWRCIYHVHKLDLSGMNLTRINLSGSNLFEANLSQSMLKEANLSFSNLMMTNISNADLRNIIFVGTKLFEANLRSSNISNGYLRNAIIPHANLCSANLYSTDLSGANLTYSGLLGADLSFANLCDADISDAFLINCKIIGRLTKISGLKNADKAIIGYWVKDNIKDDYIFARTVTNNLRNLLNLQSLRNDEEPKLTDEIKKGLELIEPPVFIII